MDRAWRKQRKIERRLGVDHMRPVGMRHSTYSRLKGKLVQCEAQRLDVLAAFVDRTQANRGR